MSDLENIPTPPTEKDRPAEDMQYEEHVSETKEHKGESSGHASSQMIKLIQEEEKKHKREDEHLIKILLEFIKKDANQTVIDLVNKLLERNVPAPFIIAILSLAYPDLINKLTTKEQQQSLTEVVAHEILKKWYLELVEVSKIFAHRILTHIGQENDKADEHIKNLLRFVIIDFYNNHNIQPDDENVTRYIDEVFSNLVNVLNTFIKSQKKLDTKP